MSLYVYVVHNTGPNQVSPSIMFRVCWMRAVILIPEYGKWSTIKWVPRWKVQFCFYWLCTTCRFLRYKFMMMDVVAGIGTCTRSSKSSSGLTCRVGCPSICLHALPVSPLLWLVGVGIPVVTSISAIGIVIILLIAIAVVPLLTSVPSIRLLRAAALAESIARRHLHAPIIRCMLPAPDHLWPHRRLYRGTSRRRRNAERKICRHHKWGTHNGKGS